MILLFLNLINCIFLLTLALYTIRNKIDIALLWYAILMLYFINVPLLYDSIMILNFGDIPFDKIQRINNRYWTTGTINFIEIISLHSLIFNITFVAGYYIINPINKIKKNASGEFIILDESLLSNIPWWFCFLISIIGFFIFLYTNQIFSISHLGTSKWYLNRIHNPILVFLSSFLVTLSPIAVFKGLCEKKWLLGFLCIIPTLIIGYITDARSQVISIGMYVLFYLIWKKNKINLSFIIVFILFLFIISYIYTTWRGGYGLFYPRTKDMSYSDLFYAYKVQNQISTNGSNTIRLVLTGLYNYTANDITVILAHYKYGMHWGSLHPTILGWAFIDLGNFFWLFSLYLGGFLAICDKIRYRIPIVINYCFLSFIFSFLAVSIRGSVQFAYSSLIYPLMAIILFYILHIKLKVI